VSTQHGDALQNPTTMVDTVVDTSSPPRTYEERKLSGWCTYGACKRRAEGWPTPIHHHCKRHRMKVQARQRRWVDAKRTELTGQGRCRRCRKPSSTVRCPRCKILEGSNLPTTVVDTVVDMTGDQWRRDADGWERFRGKGRRGAPKVSLTDEQDLITAVESLERGRQSLAYAHTAGVKARGRDAQIEARAAAASILAMVARQLAEVAARNTPVNPRVVGMRARVKEALGAGVDPEMLDDAMIDRVIAAARAA
jgi:hypothetical protein